MEIPHTALSPDTLEALIEEFVLREGTDYGEHEVPLVQKTRQILNQLERGDAVIVYDTDTESCTILTHQKFSNQQSINREEQEVINDIDGM